MLEGLAGDAATPIAELILAWAPLWDRHEQLLHVLHAQPHAPWAPALVGALRHWRTAPATAVAAARAVAAAQPLRHHLDPALAEVPAAQLRDVLFALDDALDDIDDRLLDVLLPPPGGRRDPHPLDGLGASWATRLWRRVREQARDRHIERARRALWSLAARPEAEDALAAAHGHPTRRVRLYAHRLARRSLPEDVWAALALTLLDDPHPSVQRLVLRTLAHRRYLPALPHLVEQLARGKGGDTVIDALRVYGDDALPALRHHLPKTRPDRRPRLQALLQELTSS